MKTTFMNRLAAATLTFIATLASAQAADYTWNGSGGDSRWSTGANWVGGSAFTSSNGILFSGTTGLTPNNTLTAPTVSGLTFSTNAGAFTLGGNSFILDGNIVNLSGNLQTVANDLTLKQNSVIDTGIAGITIGGNIDQSGARSLNKRGTGTLILSGTNTYTGGTFISEGRLVLDAGSGGSLSSAAGITAAGSLVGPGNQGGDFELLGKSSGGATAVSLSSYTMTTTGGATKVIVNSNGNANGASLTLASLIRQAGMGTVNFDLSSPNSSLTITGAISNSAISGQTANGISTFATVTTGGKTGFAHYAGAQTAAGAITQLDLTGVAVLPGAVGATGVNYQTSGPSSPTGNLSANSLTITGSGSLAGSFALNTSAILMQEGSGDYTLATSRVGPASRGNLFLHQYSTAGSLIIDSVIAPGGTIDANTSVLKTGGGKVINNGTSADLLGFTDIQAGEFVQNGSFSRTSAVYVRRGGRLSGSGSFGGGSGVETAVSIFSGGTLDATNTGNALDIAGSLSLSAGATFKMNLASTTAALQVTAASGTIVSLDGDLQLSLGYAPSVIDTEISLITTIGGTIGNQFATINGAAPTSLIILHYADNGYEFQLNYHANDVSLKYLGAIPEPTTVSLLLGGGATVLLLGRKRSRKGA